jgi:hypothetical protein
MAILLWDCTYNGAALESQGLVFHYSNTWNPTALGLSTFGLVVGASDIWRVVDNCEDVDWTLIEPVNDGNTSNLNWVAAYFWGANLTILSPPMVDFSCMTHVMHFNLEPQSDGTLNEDQLSAGESADSNPYSAELIWYAHASGCKALITIGGEGFDGAFEDATQPDVLPTFVDNIMEFFTRVRTYNGAQVSYDGIDIDWEPIGEDNAGLFQALIVALRSNLTGLQLTPAPLLTAAITTPFLDAAIVETAKAAEPYLDQINILTYPYGGDFSTWHINPGTSSPSIEETMLDFVAEIPASKLGFGIDFDAVTYPGSIAPNPDADDPDAVDTTYRQVMADFYDGVAGPTGTATLGLYQWDSDANSAWLLDPGSETPFAYLPGGRIVFPGAITADWNIPFSVTAWMKNFGAGEVNWQFPPSVDNPNQSYGFFGVATPSGNVFLRLQADQTHRIFKSGNIPNTAFTNYTITYDGSGNASGLKIYIDGSSAGISVDEDTLGTTPLDQTVFDFAIGQGGWQTLGIYDAELDGGETLDIFNAGQYGDLTALSSNSSLTHYYPLDGNSLDQKGAIDGVETDVEYVSPDAFWVSFQNETSISQKIEYAEDQGFGVFCWELSGGYRPDLPSNPDALMQAVKEDAGVTPGNITVWTVIPP